jgi:hypothetical protein
MAFTVSPGVVTREIDLTAIVPEIGSTAGGTAGAFQWGPILEITAISSEDDLVKRFNKPDINTYNYFFTSANFLAYGDTLSVVRVANSTVKNATSDASNTVLIQNNDEYYNTFDVTFGGAANSDYGNWAAKYGGSLGNSLKVSTCGADKSNITLTGTVEVATGSTPTLTGTGTLLTTELGVGDVLNVNSNTFLVTSISNSTIATLHAKDGTGSIQSAGSSALRLTRSGFSEPASQMMGTVTVAAGSTTVAGVDTLFDMQINTGDILSIGGQDVIVNSVSSNTSLVLRSSLTNAASTLAYSRKWEYHGAFSTSPTTTNFGTRAGTSQDEIFVAVADEDGSWTDTKGQLLETFDNLSVASNAKKDDGTGQFYKDAINKQSNYIWWLKHDTKGDRDETINTIAWGSSANTSVADRYQANGAITTSSLTGGADGNVLTDANIIAGFDKFKSAEDTNVSLILTANSNATVSSYVINNIAEVRKDCIVLVSPQQSDVVNNAGNEADSVVAFRNSLPSSSYGLLDSAWKYQYDKYNDTYRYVPCNGDTGGLTVRTAQERDFFFSPAGFDRGQIKNVTKLPFNPDKTSRDTLYKNGVNPVVTFSGQGTILFGDKTLLSKPSAFDRVNVRRLFIVLEKSIAQFAQAQLFEFNDEFTRSRFVSTVEPFLRDIQGRGGISDFAVVCDDSNNTQEVVDRSEFVGSIFVKPSRPINFILLNFVAVRSGVEFTEITNAV